MLKKSVEIRLEQGPEARTIAEMVQVASAHRSSIHIESGDTFVNAKSIMGMMALDLKNGTEITIIADGADERAAVQDMEGYLHGEKRFA